MNRDEKRSRAVGLPPSLRIVDGVKVLCPSEPSGGTWIAVNEHGVTYALINWYSVNAKVESNAVSRGDVVASTASSVDFESVSAELNKFPLRRTNPFRLIGVFPKERQLVEWRWDLQKLFRHEHPWNAQQWVSSGFDELTAQKVRSATLRAAQNQTSAGTLAWLRRLHRSHSPGRGPFSTCMHREDAVTVSYSEVVVRCGYARLGYHAGCPCEPAQPQEFFKA